MHQNNRFKSEWIGCFKNTSSNLGFSGVWEIQTVENAKWLTTALKRKIQDQYIEEWQTLLSTSNSSIYYRSIKTNFERSAYFNILPNYLSQKICIQNSKPQASGGSRQMG